MTSQPCLSNWATSASQLPNAIVAVSTMCIQRLVMKFPAIAGSYSEPCRTGMVEETKKIISRLLIIWSRRGWKASCWNNSGEVPYLCVTACLSYWVPPCHFCLCTYQNGLKVNLSILTFINLRFKSGSWWSSSRLVSWWCWWAAWEPTHLTLASDSNGTSLAWRLLCS